MIRLRRIVHAFGLGRAAGLVLLVGLIVLRVWDPPPIEELRLRTFDFYQRLAPRSATMRPVVIVDIDDESLKALGQWPWPRTLVADLVTKLTELGTLAIAFDVVFPEPDRMSPKRAADAFRGLDEETRAALMRLPGNDEVLAEAIRGSRVILGQSGFRQSVQAEAAGAVQTGFATIGADPRPYLIAFPHLLRNIPVLEQAAAGRGLFTIRPESDGIVRRVPLVMAAEGVMVPALSVEALRVVSGGQAIAVKTDAAGIRSVVVPGLEVPTDRNGQLWVHFAPHDPTKYVSAKDVIEGRVPRDRVERRLVLVGTSAVGLLDLKTTPVHPAMPGVEVHAQLLENMLTKSVLAAPNYAVGAELMLAVVLSLLMVAFGPVLGAFSLFALGGVVAAATVGTSWYFYASRSLLIDATFPLLASFLVYLVLVFTNYFRAQVERGQIRSAFGQYLSPALVEQLARSPEKLKLGGEQRDMTIMFSDVRGFTGISELYRDDPQGLTSLMNRFLTPLTNAIIGRKGTIDKYMGDAIMAFWNAPIDDTAHEAHAGEAALDMLDALKSLNDAREREAAASGQTFLPLKIGVGLNTGRCVVGNMGSDLRFDYSVLGDTVNLASRLEGQSATYGVPIVLGAKTAEAVRGSFAVVEIDLVTVKGKLQPEHVHTLLGGAEMRRSSAFETLSAAHGAMLSHYRQRDWTEARDLLQRFRQTYDEFGLGKLNEIYRQRIAEFEANPPPPDWAGVMALTTK